MSKSRHLGWTKQGKVPDMSDMREDRLRMRDKPKPPRRKDTRDYRDRLAASTDGTEFDEVMTSKLPLVSTAVELRAIPMLFPPSRVAADNAWITDQPTWMLPAMPGPSGDGKQASVPATQGSVTGKKQTSSGAQGYLSLALDMIKNSGIYALGALASPLVSLILTPFLARHLSTTDYGGLAVLYTVVDLVTVMTQFGI